MYYFMAKLTTIFSKKTRDKQVWLVMCQYQFGGSASGDKPPWGMFVSQAWL